MDGLNLYPFQMDVFTKLMVDLFNRRNALVQLPTGAGKTHVAAYLAKNIEKTIWFVCHRAELVDQTARVFSERGIEFGIVSAKGTTDPSTRVQICMVGSLPRRKFDLRRPEIIIFDECHHLGAKTWHKIAKEFDDAVLVGLTATPYRLDGAALDPYFARIINGPAVRDLIEQGFLSDFVYYAPARPDLDAVKVNRGGEYDKAELEAVMLNDVLVGDVIDHYKRLAPGRKAIVYAVSVAASIDIAARFNAAGIPAAHIDADTPKDDRKLALAALASGEIKILSNVELFTEGLDVPDVGAVILMRPTRSLGLARQMIGRGMRPGGEPLVILDHANLFAEFGTPDYEFEWSLDGKPPKWLGEGHKRSPLAGRVLDGGAREIEFVPGFLSRIAEVPEGCVTKRDFSRQLGHRSVGTVHHYISIGMPTHGGFINVEECNSWLEQRKIHIRKIKVEIANKMRSALTQEIMIENGKRLQVNLANKTPDERKLIRKKAADAMTPESRRAGGKAAMAARTPEQRSAAVKKGWDNATAEERSARAKKMRAGLSPEQRRANLEKGASTRFVKGWNTRADT